MENLLLAAESIGLGSCWIHFVTLAFGSQQGKELRKELKIPEEYGVFSGAAIGYKTEPGVEAPARKSGLITVIR